jgi:hypothetical protein
MIIEYVKLLIFFIDNGQMVPDKTYHIINANKFICKYIDKYIDKYYKLKKFNGGFIKNDDIDYELNNAVNDVNKLDKLYDETMEIHILLNKILVKLGEVYSQTNDVNINIISEQIKIISDKLKKDLSNNNVLS